MGIQFSHNKKMNMCLFLEQFWTWSNRTPEEYARDGMNQNIGEFEDDFPLFSEMLAYSRIIVDNNVIDHSIVYELITIMALDNESESVLNYIEDNSSDEQIQKIVELGISHLQPNARWQLAELIYRRKPVRFFAHLLELSKDKHPYVRQRALNCIDLL